MLALLSVAHVAGYLHRIAALVLIAEFLIVLIVSLVFLFRKNGKTAKWHQRLFDLESLFFNRKDWENMKGMFKWFFNR